jgi:hypothetical protein
MRRIEHRLYRQREAVNNEPFRDGTMNPIIKQLAEQAGMNIKTNISGVGLVFGTFEGYKTSHVSVEELEKFAELIVRDCAVLCRWEHEAHAMLEHFGVEP